MSVAEDLKAPGAGVAVRLDALRTDAEARRLFLEEQRGELQLPPTLKLADLYREQVPEYVVEDILFAGSITLAVSRPNLIKTFISLGLAGAVASGTEYLEKKVRRGDVLYVSFESGDDLGLRCLAIEQSGVPMAEHFHLVRVNEPLSPKVDRERAEVSSNGELIVAKKLTELKHPRLLVIDTVRASLTGNENDSEVVSGYFRAIRRLMKPYPDMAVLLLHHAGWTDNRERGSSDWRGTADATFYFEPKEESADLARIEMQCLKTRNEARQTILLERYVVKVNDHRLVRNDEGQQVQRGQTTTCLVRLDQRTRVEREGDEKRVAAAKAAGVELRVLKALVGQDHLTSKDAVYGRMKILEPGFKVRDSEISTALAGLLQKGLVAQEKRGRPYLVTAEGWAAAGAGIPEGEL